ncbi:MAG: bifunctional diaminohydroxyphosphoribosylaminopyrimidine deaminase/5-amino-6-(5-phosphoribosylamino)uracil reductase RibD [Sporomusaceae bacterium]|nr:bifunctional diaminohydroxyphosphoribosylaminopyrimidine deaminase/5-amino-6-(5-phosphoribosylamino)uracil reductase RibD [Sporomusaceae bacterium]
MIITKEERQYHEKFMQMAIAEAKQALGCTTPNPLVGAVIVKDDKVIGKGYHHMAGTPHAEIHALQEAGEAANGATIYVTLEPCCHHGRTGPCTEAIIAAGIRRVVVAITDPNPLVAGHGIDRLRQAGIEVLEGICCLDAVKVNEAFVKWVSTKMPFVLLKTAMTLDGKIATATGQSQWITGPAARQTVHRLRNQYDGILVGIGTVLADDPLLTTRLPEGPGCNPTRIILDSKARTPLDAKVVTNKEARTIIAVTKSASMDKVKALEAAGVTVWTISEGPSGLNLRELFSRLASYPVTSILVEGGAAVNASVLAENLADKVAWFVAPKILGGKTAPSPIGGSGVASLSQAYELEDLAIEQLEEDILISAYLKSREGRDVYRTCGRIG